MDVQTVFKRYELKYLLNPEQKERMMEAFSPYLVPDQYGKTLIRNIYFDTDQYRLVRCSIEKPAYKEKLRVRSYRQATSDSTVFVELKKKYRGVVYKRRISLPEEAAMNWLSGKCPCPKDTQISREINYFLDYYQMLRPAGFLSYRREAYYAEKQPDFRLTLDQMVLFRQEDLSLKSKVWGQALLPQDMTLMELKCAGAMPLWAARILSENHIYQTSFSKYGTAYQTIIYPNHSKEALFYA